MNSDSDLIRPLLVTIESQNLHPLGVHDIVDHGGLGELDIGTIWSAAPVALDIRVTLPTERVPLRQVSKTQRKTD